MVLVQVLPDGEGEPVLALVVPEAEPGVGGVEAPEEEREAGGEARRQGPRPRPKFHLRHCYQVQSKVLNCSTRNEIYWTDLRSAGIKNTSWLIMWLQILYVNILFYVRVDDCFILNIPLPNYKACTLSFFIYIKD